MATAFEVNALRENERPGLDPGGRSGRPVDEIASLILEAAKGEAGEVWLEREGRWMAAAALMWPALVERRLRPLRDRALAYTESGKPHGDRRWRLWQVETSMACHLDCIMCPWKGVRAAAGEALMSDAVWEKLRPHLPEVASVDFSGGGEPLTNPKLCAWLAEARSCGCTAGFLTNGMLLEEEMCRAVLEAAADWVAVSVDGADAETYEAVRRGACFETVTRNIKALSSMRVDRVPRLALNFVMMPMNVHQLESIVQLAKDLGVDQVNFKQCDVVRGAHGRHDHGKQLGLFASREDKEQRRHQQALDRARSAARRMGIETTAFSFVPDEMAVCDQDPRNSIFIRYDGKVAPCINQAYGGEVCFLGGTTQMPTVHYGSVLKADLAQIWETDVCRRYRGIFQERVRDHDAKLMSSGLGSSIDELKQAFQQAKDAMPAPPGGCDVCHYLYDV